MQNAQVVEVELRVHLFTLLIKQILVLPLRVEAWLVGTGLTLLFFGDVYTPGCGKLVSFRMLQHRFSVSEQTHVLLAG